MQQTCTRTTLPRRNVIAHSAIRAVKRVVGERVLIIARSLVKPTVLRNVLRDVALGQSLESAVTW